MLQSDVSPSCHVVINCTALRQLHFFLKRELLFRFINALEGLNFEANCACSPTRLFSRSRSHIAGKLAQRAGRSLVIFSSKFVSGTVCFRCIQSPSKIQKRARVKRDQATRREKWAQITGTRTVAGTVRSSRTSSETDIREVKKVCNMKIADYLQHLYKRI